MRCPSEPEADPSPSYPAQAGQQPSRMFARPGASTRAEAARFQVAPISAALPFNACNHLRQERLGDAVRHGPEHLAGDRLDEGGDVQPLVAVVAEGDGTLTLGGPHPPDDRLQADAVLVRGP